MGKVVQVQNGDSGLKARLAWNEALKDVDVTDIASGTAGELITWDASGNADTVPAGTEDYVLTGNGTGAKPTYQDPATNPLVLGLVSGLIWNKSYSFKSRSGTSGVNYLAGFYAAPSADANLTQASTTVVYGTANSSYAAHAFIVAGGAGTASGGSGAVTITVTGTSITDAGVRTAADTETIVADITTMTTDQYIEGPKKWIGQITFTLDVGATGHTAYAADFNYGISKYEDLYNQDFQLNAFETVGEANANDSGFNLECLLHDGTGWTYSAAAFSPGGTVICSMNTDHATEIDIDSGEPFAYKRVNLNTLIEGSGSEGVVIRVTTNTNNSVANMDCHLSGLITDTLIT